MQKPGQCRLCGARLDAPEVIAEYVFGGQAGQCFYSCPVCHVAFLYPPMTVEEENQFYAKEFEKFMESRSGGDLDWSGPQAHIQTNRQQYERRHRLFCHLLAPGKRVLEVGCSSGFMLLPLQGLGMEVCGVEPSGGFTSFLQEKRIPVYESVEALKKSDIRPEFDLVMHYFVLEHIRRPVEFLSELMELVKPGGHMVFEIPNRNDPLVSIYNIPAFHRFYWSIAHNYYFNHPSVGWVLDQLKVSYEILNDQRYDLSNHMTWAIQGKPGGQGRFSGMFTPELEQAYRQSMIQTGHCDTLFVIIKK
ncbi:MAG: class I SAM-dependent methyltransferase [Solirubrobacterales bacterium]